MSGYNTNLDLVNMNASIQLDEILLICGNEILTSIKDHYSVTNLRNIMRNNPNRDLVNVIAHIYFDEIKDHNSFTNMGKLQIIIPILSISCIYKIW